jgi:hypothetical protein
MTNKTIENLKKANEILDNILKSCLVPRQQSVWVKKEQAYLKRWGKENRVGRSCVL